MGVVKVMVTLLIVGMMMMKMMVMMMIVVVGDADDKGDTIDGGDCDDEYDG